MLRRSAPLHLDITFNIPTVFNSNMILILIDQLSDFGALTETSISLFRADGVKLSDHFI